MRSVKVWTDAFDVVNKLVEDLEVLNEFHDAGDASDDELEREYQKTAKAVEELEFKKMLSRDEDQLSAI
ncbi:MAG: peptide chain release factor 2, partial [Cytophagia bacterium]|nr:peptide chain release factor 2 [Cytophagia bacterium]